MNILIIGGTGLISTYITRQLLERGDQVTHYNRGKSSPQVPEGVTQIIGDRTDYARFEQQMAELGSFDCVIDMVCYEPEDARSTVRAITGKTGQYILCSTIDVYTKPASRYPITEDEPRTAIADFDYALKKVECEQIAFAAHERGDLKVTVIRPAATHGEGRGIIHSLGWSNTHIDRIRKGKPIVMHGDGNSLWVQCHADDVARAFVGAIGNAKAFGKGYHATGEEWLTWNALQRTVTRVLGAPEPKFVYIPSETLNRLAYIHGNICLINFQFNNIFDNTAARTDLGFRYTITWEESVRRIVTWLDEHDAIPNSDDDPIDDRVIAAYEAGVLHAKELLSDLKGL